MIDLALTLLRDELVSYVNHLNDVIDISINNIGMLETADNGASLSESIVITLVNIEEESTLKNQTAVKRPFLNNTAVYENPPVFLNLYVLFTSNFKAYTLALKRLSYVIQFLQRKNSFSSSTSVAANNVSVFDPKNLIDLKFTLELYTLTFEQINHLWGSLGGRQIPFVMYKLRLVGITDKTPVREVPLIEEIDTTILKTQRNN
jgi:hypothetical protein